VSNIAPISRLYQRVMVVVVVVLFFCKEMNARARVRFVFVWAKFLLSLVLDTGPKRKYVTFQKFSSPEKVPSSCFDFFTRTGDARAITFPPLASSPFFAFSSFFSFHLFTKKFGDGVTFVL